MALIAYATGTMFMSVWGLGTDAILQCFCIDRELNKNSGKANKYCPNQLLEFVQDPKYVKIAEEAKKKRDARKAAYNAGK